LTLFFLLRLTAKEDGTTMNKRNLLTIGGVVVLGLALVALPASSARPQRPNDSKIARFEERIEDLQAKLQAELETRQDQKVELADADEPEESTQAVVAGDQDPTRVEVMPEIATDDLNIMIGDDGSSWLGVETHEVTAEKAKELKLSAERGVVLGKIVPDSPAAKAGLKENDVVTEINGQRVEGAAQFRRIIHEIPAGRSIQLTVWRDGRSQTISATLGKSEERRHAMKMVAPTPGTFAFRMPEMPDMPSMEWNGNMLFGSGQPRLGIDAEDLSGQLGTFFGAPEGEGILVRDVNSGSPAEKAGVKAGDVITSLNGERIRTIGELREKLSAKREDNNKDRTVKLGILRNKSEISLTAELPAPAARTKRLVSRRTSI
jgi:C-terminal processing protease CtpA/Prc